MSKIDDANKIIDPIRLKSDRAILFYSCGKDSIVLLDLMAKRFEEVLCVFMYFVKDLDHVNRYINWAEKKYPNAKFIQVPHWGLSRIKRCGTYCVPDPKTKLLKLKDVETAIRLKYGIQYAFYGMKKADSMNRNLMLRNLPDGEMNGAVYPLLSWTQRDILAYMKQNKLPMPIRYSKNASGGVGFNIECFLWMRENAPGDLEKVYQAFPMSRRILYEYDYQNGK